MFRASEFSSRNQFGKYLNNKGLLGLAVEVGTHRADYARILRRDWKGKCLYCVDPWIIPEGYEPQAKCLWLSKGGSRELDYKEAVRVALEFNRNTMKLLLMTSLDAIHQFDPGTIDFAYIDGDHRYEHVIQDLIGWWDRIRVGGILAGHDWIQPGESHSWAEGIQQAVQEFKILYKTTVWLIVEEGNLPWSYYMIKE